MSGLRAMLLVVVLLTGCAHVESAPGLELTPAEQNDLSSAVDTAAFWNPSCARSQIVVQRVDPHRMMVELSVCGETRRYQRIRPPQGWDVWLDVPRATEAGPAGLRPSSSGDQS
jgi:hypothetical protein